MTLFPVALPSLNSSVFLQYLSGFFNRQGLDRVPASGHCRCSKKGVVHRFLGGFNYRQKPWGHRVVRQHINVY